MKTLVITVGGSRQPVITSIKNNSPDKVCFICSDDVATARGSYTELDSIIQEYGLAPASIETIRIKHFDDFNDCYQQCCQLLTRLRQDNREGSIITDYTGGTKSMSAGLAAAAMDVGGCCLCIVTGERVDLKQVQNGTQCVRLSYAYDILIQRQHKIIGYLVKQFDYFSAITMLEDLLQIPDINPKEAGLLGQWLSVCRALQSWDGFDHATAWRVLAPHKKEYLDLVKFLQAVMWSRQRYDVEFKGVLPDGIGAPRGHGYEIVEDLILNARRRASQGRYDDAVGRLYRALELLVQIRLATREPSINTSDVDTNNLPAVIRKEYDRERNGKGRIMLGLQKSYELLSRLSEYEEEPLGKHYLKSESALRGFLEKRNNSLFAHGMTPVSGSDYQKAVDFAESFINGAISEMIKSSKAGKYYASACQFPARLIPPE